MVQGLTYRPGHRLVADTNVVIFDLRSKGCGFTRVGKADGSRPYDRVTGREILITGIPERPLF